MKRGYPWNDGRDTVYLDSDDVELAALMFDEGKTTDEVIAAFRALDYPFAATAKIILIARRERATVTSPDDAKP